MIKWEVINMKELRVLSPTAILGYGFPEESFLEGIKKKSSCNSG